MPTRPAHAPPGGNTVNIRVTRRLLWVDQAVYPLANITRVHTSTFHPNRWRAFVSCVKVVGATVAVTLVLALLSAVASGVDSDSGSSDFFGLVGAVTSVIAIFAIIKMLIVMFSPSYPILVIETSGPPAVLIPGTDRAALQEITLQISRSLENPDIELTLKVQSLTIGNTSNYHYGDTVNMFGGERNTGVSR